jgi:hypothetical protein
MASCTTASPEGLICGRLEHSPAVAHHARGESADGTHWAVFWWDPERVNGHERPPVRNGIPLPRPSGD